MDALAIYRVAAVLLLALALFPASAGAVMLTYENGMPLPRTDPRQRLAADMQVASYRGPLAFSDHILADCGTAEGGCAAAPCWGGPVAEVFVSRTPRQAVRGALYHELGHEFDCRYLTADDRAWLSVLISRDTYRPIGPWEEADASNHWNGYQDIFAEFYADCAQRNPDFPWPHDPQLCAYVNLVGRARHASPPARPRSWLSSPSRRGDRT